MEFNKNIMNNTITNGHFKCELVPYELKKIEVLKYQTISISDIGKLGSLSIPVINAIENTMGAGGSGLYMVDTDGGTLFQSAVKGGFIGGMKTATGGIGQSTLSPVIFNPITLGVALTIVSMFTKLDSIESSCNKIYDYITIGDKAELSDNYKKLFQIYNEYNENYNNEKAVIEFIHVISIIKCNAGKMIEVYKPLIKKEIENNKFNIDDKSVINNAKELIDYCYYLKLSTFNYAFSTMLSIFIEEKFNHDTLERCYEDINKKNDDVCDLFDEAKSYLLKEFDKSLMKKDLILAVASREISSVIPVLKNIKPLKEFSDKKIEKKVNKVIDGEDYINNIFTENSELNVKELNNNIKLVDQIFNSHAQILCDKNNFYIRKEI